ncbi:hypothetical protein CsSME_00003625 [Camellia sinensis var. sinensis]
MATRDVVALSGGPSYAVELGRLDGLSSTAASVNGKLPQPGFNLNQLNSMFAAHGLSQTDMIALSAGLQTGYTISAVRTQWTPRSTNHMQLNCNPCAQGM